MGETRISLCIWTVSYLTWRVDGYPYLRTKSRSFLLRRLSLSTSIPVNLYGLTSRVRFEVSESILAFLTEWRNLFLFLAIFYEDLWNYYYEEICQFSEYFYYVGWKLRRDTWLNVAKNVINCCWSKPISWLNYNLCPNSVEPQFLWAPIPHHKNG